MRRIIKISLYIIFYVYLFNIFGCPALKADNLWKNLLHNDRRTIVLSQRLPSVSSKPLSFSLLIDKLIKLPSEQYKGLSVKFSHLNRARNYIMSIPSEIKVSEDSREIVMGNLVGDTFSVAMGIAFFIPLNLCLYAVYQRRLILRQNSLFHHISMNEDVCSELYQTQGELLGSHYFELCDNELMRDLRNLMRTEVLYTDPGLLCSDVARRLAVTESDITYAVNNGSSIYSFEDYIDWLRLNHVRNLIPYSIYTPLTTIVASAGFSSYKRFHALFLREYGMSPKTFYKMARIN